MDNISQSLSPCCSSCATGLLQNKDQNNLAVKGFFPAPSGSGPTKTPLKFQSLQCFFLIEFNKNVVFWLFFFFRHFFVIHVRQGSSLQQAHSTQVPCFWVYDLVFGFPSSTNWLQMKVWSKKYSISPKSIPNSEKQKQLPNTQ